MATIEIKDGALTVHVTGIDRLFALRSSLSVPLAHVARVVPRPAVPELWAIEAGTKFRGVQRPGTLCAGTVTQGDGEGYVFCDVHDPQQAIAVELHHDACKRLIVELSDETPEVAAQRITDAVHALREGVSSRG